MDCNNDGSKSKTVQLEQNIYMSQGTNNFSSTLTSTFSTESVISSDSSKSAAFPGRLWSLMPKKKAKIVVSNVINYTKEDFMNELLQRVVAWIMFARGLKVVDCQCLELGAAWVAARIEEVGRYAKILGSIRGCDSVNYVDMKQSLLEYLGWASMSKVLDSDTCCDIVAAGPFPREMPRMRLYVPVYYSIDSWICPQNYSDMLTHEVPSDLNKESFTPDNRNKINHNYETDYKECEHNEFYLEENCSITSIKDNSSVQMSNCNSSSSCNSISNYSGICPFGNSTVNQNSTDITNGVDSKTNISNSMSCYSKICKLDITRNSTMGSMSNSNNRNNDSENLKNIKKNKWSPPHIHPHMPRYPEDYLYKRTPTYLSSTSTSSLQQKLLLDKLLLQLQIPIVDRNKSMNQDSLGNIL